MWNLAGLPRPVHDVCPATGTFGTPIPKACRSHARQGQPAGLHPFAAVPDLNASAEGLPEHQITAQSHSETLDPTYPLAQAVADFVTAAGGTADLPSYRNGALLPDTQRPDRAGAYLLRGQPYPHATLRDADKHGHHGPGHRTDGLRLEPRRSDGRDAHAADGIVTSRWSGMSRRMYLLSGFLTSRSSQARPIRRRDRRPDELHAEQPRLRERQPAG